MEVSRWIRLARQGDISVVETSSNLFNDASWAAHAAGKSVQLASFIAAGGGEWQFAFSVEFERLADGDDRPAYRLWQNNPRPCNDACDFQSSQPHAASTLNFHA